MVYTRGWIDWKTDRRPNEIWIMDADGSRKRFLTKGSSPTWSPDGTRLAFTMEVPDGHSWSVPMPRRPDGATWTPGPKIVERAVYRRDRQGYVDETWSHLFVVSAEGGAVRQLTDGDWNHSAGKWTPDGSELLFSSLRVEDAELQWRHSEIYSVTVADGTIRRLTDRRGQDSGPVPSPDGRSIAYLGDDWHTDTYRNRQIHLMDRDGSNPRVISGDFDRGVQNLTWASDGSGLYFTSPSEGNQNVHFVSVNGGVRPITEGIHQLSLSSMSDAGRMAVTRTSFLEPGDIWLLDPARPAAMTRLTEANRDLMAGVDTLISRGYVDESRMYVYGCSGGGVPTAMLRFQDEWHGTSSRPTNFIRTQLYLRSWFERWGGPPTPITQEEDGPR